MQALSAIVGWSLRHRAVVLVATLLFIGMGIKAAVDLRIDAVPDVTTVQVQIITSAPALSPVEVEQYVTVPVERSMSGLPHVEEIRSLSKYGISVVTVVFSENTDVYFARQMVAERMRDAEDTVPARYGRPEMGPIASGLGEIYQFVVRGQGHSLMALQETLDWYITPQLLSVPGINEVNSFGGENRQYQVVINPGRLSAAGLSVNDVVAAIKKTNANAGGGYIESNREQLVIGSLGLVKDLEDLRSVVIGTTSEGVPITVANVGDVRFGPRLRRGAASMDAKGEVVVGVALMLIGENSRIVTEGVKNKLAELAPTLPKGMVVEAFYDRSALVNRTVRTVAVNLAEGAALVVLVLFIVLGDLRAGLIVAITIPLAMFFALILMNLTGASGNLMSLGAIDFGLIVDASVIIVENAVRRLSERRRLQGRSLGADERLDVVRDAAVEVRGASIYGEAIIAIVYVPILTLRGIEGKLFEPMATTVLFALLGAFVVSMTVIPVLCSLFLVPRAHEHETVFMRWSQKLYAPFLKSAVRRPVLTVVLGFVVAGAGVAMASRLGSEFVPQLDEGDLLVEARRLPGVSLTESIAMDQRIQQALVHIPEIVHVVNKTGAPELATDPMGIEQTDVYISLKERKDWRPGLTKAALGAEITAAIEKEVPEIAGSLSQPIQMRTNELVAGVRSDVAAQIFGPDLTTLQSLGDRIVNVLQKVPGAQDVRAEQGSGLTYLRIRPDRIRLARYGLTVDDVNTMTETISVGQMAGSIMEGDRRFSLVVKLEHGFAGNLDALRALPLKATTGQMVPLGDVAEVFLEKGPALVNRDKLSRRLIVEFNVRDRDLGSVVRDAQAATAKHISLPDGYRIEWGGQFRNFINARQRLLVVVPMALALILFLLWMALGRVKSAALIFINIPFAIIGGVALLWVRDIPFSISAGVGFIALFGVAVLNGLVLVLFSKTLEDTGTEPADAIVTSAEMRLRPVLMTALVAGLGFLPMALSEAPGSEVQRPLATVVIGGLVTATALTLLLFPAVYRLAYPRRARGGGLDG